MRCRQPGSAITTCPTSSSKQKWPSEKRNSRRLRVSGSHEKRAVLESISVGPTGRIASVRGYAALLLPAGPPTPSSVGPTGRIASVRRYAAFLLPAGPPTPSIQDWHLGGHSSVRSRFPSPACSAVSLPRRSLQQRTRRESHLRRVR